MNYKELEKLYPEFKIPVQTHAEYYINSLIFGDYVSIKPLEDMVLFEKNSTEELGSLKHKKLAEVIDFFKTNGFVELLNSFEVPKHDYTCLSFSNYKDGKYYVSIDLSSANWQAFQLVTGIIEDYKSYVERNFNFPEILSNSKSFRQFILGNTNPKKLSKISEYLMSKIYSNLSLELRTKVVGKNSDELIFEFDSFPRVFFNELFSFANTKTKIFKFFLVNNYSETIKVAHYVDKDFNFEENVKLKEVPGNRFFIHYKSIVLEEPIEERDLLFENDKKLAKWII